MRNFTWILFLSFLFFALGCGDQNSQNSSNKKVDQTKVKPKKQTQPNQKNKTKQNSLLADYFHKAKRENAKLTIKTIGQVLQMYYIEHGDYPPSGDGYSDTALVNYLDGEKENGGPATQYFEFPKGSEQKFLDPWGNPYYYREFKSKDLRAKKKTGDPRSEIILFRSFQIYSKGHRPDEPETWITNYRKD